MAKKVLTKEQRYVLNMRTNGFVRKSVWVHKDDWQMLIIYLKSLRKIRRNKEIRQSKKD